MLGPVITTAQATDLRIPLIRFGGDDRPFAWWELLFFPVIMPLITVLFFTAAVVSVPVELIYRARQNRREKQLPQALAARGRFAPWPEVEAALVAGRGTLIVEHRSPKGPIREWWTPDDLPAASPVPLPASIRQLPTEGQARAALREYALRCAAEYVDPEVGRAKLTQVPVPTARRLDPRKYVVVDLGDGVMTAILFVKGRDFAVRYPRANIVTLIHWDEEPILAAGDAEAVFLSAG